MIEFYAEIRLVHIWSVIASGALFLARGLMLFWGAGGTGERIAMAVPVRLLTYAIDTVLLTAALMLMTIMQQYPFVDHWLTVKVALLVAYIAFGMVAFRFGRTQRMRIGAFATALAVFLYIVSVALAHHPAGIFSGHIF